MYINLLQRIVLYSTDEITFLLVIRWNRCRLGLFIFRVFVAVIFVLIRMFFLYGVGSMRSCLVRIWLCRFRSLGRTGAFISRSSSTIPLLKSCLFRPWRCSLLLILFNFSSCSKIDSRAQVAKLVFQAAFHLAWPQVFSRSLIVIWLIKRALLPNWFCFYLIFYSISI